MKDIMIIRNRKEELAKQYRDNLNKCIEELMQKIDYYEDEDSFNIRKEIAKSQSSEYIKGIL